MHTHVIIPKFMFAAATFFVSINIYLCTATTLRDLSKEKLVDAMPKSLDIASP